MEVPVSNRANSTELYSCFREILWNNYLNASRNQRNIFNICLVMNSAIKNEPVWLITLLTCPSNRAKNLTTFSSASWALFVF